MDTSVPFSGAPRDARQDLLHRLPNELLSEILKECSDFTSLWSLINVSPSLLSIYNANAPEIVEAVLGSSVPAQIQSLMRGVLRIRAGSFMHPTLSGAAKFAFEVSELPTLVASPGLLRRFVGLAHKIHLLAHSCVDRCIQRCTTFQSHLSKGLGPPSWAEEQRAMLSFWLLQFFFELKVARLKGRLNWLYNDLSRLKFMTIDHFYNNEFVLQQVLTACDFVQELRASDISKLPSRESVSGWSCSTPPFLLPNPPREFEFGWTCQPHPSPQGLRRQDWQKLEQQDIKLLTGVSPAPLFVLRPSCVGFRRFRHPRPVLNFGRDPPGQEWQHFHHITLAWEFFLSMIDNPKAGPLQHVIVFQWRKFGFILWEEKRMMDLGFWSSRALTDASGYYRRWCSVLSEDKIAKNSRDPDDDW